MNDPGDFRHVRVELPAEDDVAFGAREAVDGDGVVGAGLRVEGRLAREEAAAILVRGHEGQVRQARAGIDSKQGVEGAAARAERGGPSGRGHPF